MSRGLTLDLARRGYQPPTRSRDEWRAMHVASLLAEADARQRTRDLLVFHAHRPAPAASPCLTTNASP